MVTLRNWPDDEPDNYDDKLRTLMVGAAAAAAALAALMGIGMAVVAVVAGPNRQPAFDPNQTVTYRGQVFAHFQPDKLTAGGIAETVRGTPLQVDQLWNLIPPRDEITINGVVYGDCEGHDPIVHASLTYRELVCHRRRCAGSQSLGGRARLDPCVLLTGNTVHDSGKGLERIRSVVPAWRYQLWPAASHALPVEVPGEVNACIRQFVIEHRNGA